VHLTIALSVLDPTLSFEAVLYVDSDDIPRPIFWWLQSSYLRNDIQVPDDPFPASSRASIRL